MHSTVGVLRNALAHNGKGDTATTCVSLMLPPLKAYVKLKPEPTPPCSPLLFTTTIPVEAAGYFVIILRTASPAASCGVIPRRILSTANALSAVKYRAVANILYRLSLYINRMVINAS